MFIYFFANNNHSLSSSHLDHQAKHIYDKPCLKAPMAIMSFGSTHGCDDVLLFALPLSACQSILPIQLTDNFMAKPLNAQATAGRGSIMNTCWMESESDLVRVETSIPTIHLRMWPFHNLVHKKLKMYIVILLSASSSCCSRAEKCWAHTVGQGMDGYVL